MTVRSQNGWPVLDSPPPATTPYITGRVLPGDVDVVFTWLGEQFDRRVEHIRKDWSWGWAPRPIRGTTTIYSNHASATANDFNAPAHPLGKRGTFTTKQVSAIHAILRDLEGVIRWGGDYVNRADEMHFEIVANAAAVKRVADKIRNGTIGGAKPWRWNPEVVSDLALVQRQFQIVQGMREGSIQRFHGVAAIQHALNTKFLAKDEQLAVDGYAGLATMQAWRRFESTHRGTNSPGTPDPVSLRDLEILYRFTGPETT